MKKLNTYIKEGLFDNIGIGPETQIEDWIKDNMPHLTRVDNIYKLKTRRNLYYIDLKDYTISISAGSTRVFCPDILKKNSLTIPSFIKIKKIDGSAAMIGPGVGFFVVCTNINFEDWHSYPEKILPTKKITTFDSENNNITDADLKMLDLTKKYDIDEWYLSGCMGIKNPEIKIKGVGIENKGRVNFEFMRSGIESLSNIDINVGDDVDARLNINACTKLKKLGFKIHCKEFELNTMGTKLFDGLRKLKETYDEETFKKDPIMQEIIKITKDNCSTVQLNLNSMAMFSGHSSVLYRFKEGKTLYEIY